MIVFYLKNSYDEINRVYFGIDEKYFFLKNFSGIDKWSKITIPL